MAIKQGTDELILLRPVGAKEDADKVMWIIFFSRVLNLIC
jgi:hypothetical protein